MTMTPYNGDLTQALKWLQNNAPNIQSLVNQKANWYTQFNDQFWADWETNIFNISTANPFGIMIWCIILNVPASLFGLYVTGQTSWAYGANRQNYVYSALHVESNPNTVGGNFYGGENTTIVNIQEARWVLMLRCAALVSNGRLSYINQMLKFIFNSNQAWNFPGKSYFYVTDSTAPAQTLVPTAPVTTPFYMEYRIGLNFSVSSQFINILNSPQYGIVPTCAGSKYLVVQET